MPALSGTGTADGRDHKANVVKLVPNTGSSSRRRSTRGEGCPTCPARSTNGTLRGRRVHSDATVIHALHNSLDGNEVFRTTNGPNNTKLACISQECFNALRDQILKYARLARCVAQHLDGGKSVPTVAIVDKFERCDGFNRELEARRNFCRWGSIGIRRDRSELGELKEVGVVCAGRQAVLPTTGDELSCGASLCRAVERFKECEPTDRLPCTVKLDGFSEEQRFFERQCREQTHVARAPRLRYQWFRAAVRRRVRGVFGFGGLILNLRRLVLDFLEEFGRSARFRVACLVTQEGLLLARRWVTSRAA